MQKKFRRNKSVQGMFVALPYEEASS